MHRYSSSTTFGRPQFSMCHTCWLPPLLFAFRWPTDPPPEAATSEQAAAAYRHDALALLADVLSKHDQLEAAAQQRQLSDTAVLSARLKQLSCLVPHSWFHTLRVSRGCHLSRASKVLPFNKILLFEFLACNVCCCRQRRRDWTFQALMRLSLPGRQPAAAGSIKCSRCVADVVPSRQSSECSLLVLALMPALELLPQFVTKTWTVWRRLVMACLRSWQPLPSRPLRATLR